jgi:nitroimidazol reductase NimA-like FMN-containing flavoprotein (pyridoxamine 5'-phosphate oxidase superfamily)
LWVNFSVFNCVSTDIKLYVHPVVLLGSTLELLTKEWSVCLVVDNEHRMVRDHEDGKN